MLVRGHSVTRRSASWLPFGPPRIRLLIGPQVENPSGFRRFGSGVKYIQHTAGGVVFCLLGGWSGRLQNRLDSSIAISCSSQGGTVGSHCTAHSCGGCRILGAGGSPL